MRVSWLAFECMSEARETSNKALRISIFPLLQDFSVAEKQGLHFCGILEGPMVGCHFCGSIHLLVVDGRTEGVRKEFQWRCLRFVPAVVFYLLFDCAKQNLFKGIGVSGEGNGISSDSLQAICSDRCRIFGPVSKDGNRSFHVVLVELLVCFFPMDETSAD